LDPEYASKLGVNLSELVITQPDYLEKLFEMIEGTSEVAKKYRLAGQRFPVLVVLDSINAMPTKAEFEATWEAQHMGAAASVYSAKLKRLVPIISREDVALLLISQEREKIGIMFGRKEQTGGGKAPRYFSSLVLEVTRKGSVKKADGSEEGVGDETEVKCTKNQIAPPFRKAEFRIMYGAGIDRDDALMREALRRGVIVRSGAWYSLNDERLGQGEQKVRERIASDPKIKNWLERAIKE
jgi:recombination protein RecA